MEEKKRGGEKMNGRGGERWRVKYGRKERRKSVELRGRGRERT